MTIETANYLDQLNSAYPRSTDLLKEGDDHIRMIKRSVRQSFPNIKGAVTISSDTLNNLNTQMSFQTSGIRVNADITFVSGKSINFSNNTLNNVGTPSATKDAANKEYIDNMFLSLYPIGSLYLTTINKNPKTLPMFNTVANPTDWIPYGEGAALVGVGTVGSYQIDIDTIQGEGSHTITENELPSHTHNVTVTGTTAPDGSHDHSYSEAYNAPSSATSGVSPPNAPYMAHRTSRTSTDGSHTHTFTGNGTTDPTGNSQGMNIVQPSIGVYIWKRVS